MESFDSAWALEWKVRNGPATTTFGVPCGDGTLRTLDQCGMCCSVYEVTEPLGQESGWMRVSNEVGENLGHCSSIAYGVVSGGELVSVADFSQWLSMLWTSPNSSLRGKLTQERRTRQLASMEAAGALIRDDRAVAFDVWHPALRNGGAVFYERRNRSMREEMLGKLQTWWGRLLFNILGRAVTDVIPGAGCLSVGLADFATTELLWEVCRPSTLLLHNHGVLVHSGGASKSRQVSFESKNPLLGMSGPRLYAELVDSVPVRWILFQPLYCQPLFGSALANPFFDEVLPDRVSAPGVEWSNGIATLDIDVINEVAPDVILASSGYGLGGEDKYQSWSSAWPPPWLQVQQG